MPYFLPLPKVSIKMQSLRIFQQPKRKQIQIRTQTLLVTSSFIDGMALGALHLEDLLPRGNISRRCFSERRHLSDHDATLALNLNDDHTVRFQNFRAPSNLGKRWLLGGEMTRVSPRSSTLTPLAARMRKNGHPLF